MTTRLRADIRQEPARLRETVRHLAGPMARQIDRAAAILEPARSVIVTGIGSSWHAGMAVQAALAEAGCAAILADASDLLHFGAFTPGSVVLVLSRSGASVEIAGLAARARREGIPLVAVTNTPESPLTAHADAVVTLGTAFDHLISITMYSGLAVAGVAIAERIRGRWSASLRAQIDDGLAEADARMSEWEDACADHPWFVAEGAHYFLARGAALASASETRLLWEEAAKAPATALTTGHFRHGPQEIVVPGLRVCCWLDAQRLRQEDVTLIAELRRHFTRVAVIGSRLADIDADLALEVPDMPRGWQFAVDCMPAQVMAEYQARLRGVDCDAFRLCPYVITAEGGLLAAAGTP